MNKDRRYDQFIIKNNSFMENTKLMALGLAAALIIGGGSYYIFKDPSEWLEYSQQVQQTKEMKDVIADRFVTEKNRLAEIHKDNQDIIEKLSKHTYYLGQKHGDPNYVMSLKVQEQNSYNSINNNLIRGEEVVNKLYEISNDFEHANKEYKKQYLTPESMLLYTDMRTTGPKIYTISLFNLSNSMKADLEEAESVSKEIVSFVDQKIKDKSYNLNTAESQILDGLKKDIDSDIQEILANNTSSDLDKSDYEQINNEVKNIADQTTKVAEEKVKEDKQKVENMLKDSQASTSNALASTGNANNSSGSHWSFADYYLMYHWLNMGSTSNYNTSSAMGFASQSQSRSDKDKKSGYVGSGVVVPNSTSAVGPRDIIAKNAQPLPPSKPSILNQVGKNINPYSLKNPNSDLSKVVDSKIGKTTSGFGGLKSSFKSKLASIKASRVSAKVSIKAPSMSSRGFGGSRGGSFGG